MAGVTGDILQVSLKGTLSSSVFRNVWYYQLMDSGTAGYVTGLLTDFQTTVLAPYAAALTTQWVFNEITVLNIFSGDIAIDVTPTPAAGTRTPSGDLLPRNIALMIVLERQNSRVRNGRKFIPIPLEADNAGDAPASGFLTLATTLANACAASINAGGVDLFTPAIVGRIAYTTSSGKTAYRLPASQGEMGDKFSLVDTARAINRTTTMNSRKFWRGE